ncbi:hypothetical protein J4573_53135 [Actinomadura barringtoniae]|uniref:Uncharacterized protein n=1 Tax=Actinomadura barringtoniae TaxID=1427535 RepID=A0A939TAW9_9ACTN|nr:hypothetical protein [Actinomadura barringtoniae]MBO2455904.1 hypothetical protein [Actinomadura barringtoniae]
MAEHQKVTDPTEGPVRRRKVPIWRAEGTTLARKRAVNAVAWAVSLATTIVVLILAVHIVFVAFEANASNDLVKHVADWADTLAWQFKDVFQPSNPKWEVAVNYGLAAVVYLIVGRIVTSLIRRLA